MKKEAPEEKKTKKQPYVKPCIEVTHLPEEPCLASVSNQPPSTGETYYKAKKNGLTIPLWNADHLLDNEK